MKKSFIILASLIIFCVAGMQVVFAQRVLTLEESIEIARNSSPDIRQAQFSLERSSENLKAQEAALKSRFSLTLTPIDYTKQNEFNTFFATWNTSELKESAGTFVVSQPIIWTDGTLALRNQLTWRDSFSEFQNVRSKTYSNNLYLIYDQPLFTYNHTRLALEEVELDLERSSLNFSLQELRLEQVITQSFYQVYQLTLGLQISREDMNNREQSYKIIKNKVEAGLAAKEELLQAELDLSSSQSQVQNQQVSLENALDNFKQLIGMNIDEQINVVAAIDQEPVKVNLQKALSEGLKNRLELRQRDIDMQIAHANVVRSEATNEFKGNLSLSYGIIGNNEELGGVYDTPTRNQRAAISFEIPIWDWGQQESQVKASIASVKSTELTLDEQKKDIRIAIRRAARNLENLAGQIELARKNVEIAQLTYEINLERYENGDLTSMDLNLFQNQLSQKKNGLIDAMINYKLALLTLKIESLWDFTTDKPVLKINPRENKQ